MILGHFGLRLILVAVRTVKPKTREVGGTADVVA
jgi:hypothetical protein